MAASPVCGGVAGATWPAVCCCASTALVENDAATMAFTKSRLCTITPPGRSTDSRSSSRRALPVRVPGPGSRCAFPVHAERKPGTREDLFPPLPVAPHRPPLRQNPDTSPHTRSTGQTPLHENSTSAFPSLANRKFSSPQPPRLASPGPQHLHASPPCPRPSASRRSTRMIADMRARSLRRPRGHLFGSKRLDRVNSSRAARRQIARKRRRCG